jgi:hypothetical protein
MKEWGGWLEIEDVKEECFKFSFVLRLNIHSNNAMLYPNVASTQNEIETLLIRYRL